MKRLLLVLPALLLAACGGSSVGDSGSAAEDPKAAFVAAAGDVCSKAQADAEALTFPTTAEAIKPFVDGSLAIAKEAQTGLAALTPPPADEQQLRSKVLDPFEALVAEGEAYAAKVTAAGTDSAKLLPLLSEQPTAEGIDLAYLRSYGLGTCADVIDTSS